jgi:hypothetical protein
MICAKYCNYTFVCLVRCAQMIVHIFSKSILYIGVHLLQKKINFETLKRIFEIQFSYFFPWTQLNIHCLQNNATIRFIDVDEICP